MVYGSWFTVHGFWFMLSGLRFMVHGLKRTVLWFSIHVSRFTVYGEGCIGKCRRLHSLVEPLDPKHARERFRQTPVHHTVGYAGFDPPSHGRGT